MGQFVNGDWWVVPNTPDGTVTVLSVTPEPTTGRSGSSVNPPGNSQGYDDRIAQYNADLRASFPLILQPNQSLVSTASNPSSTSSPNGDNWSALLRASVLTCLGVPPPGSAFRPPYVGSSYKPLFLADNLNTSLLPGLTPASGTMPSISFHEARFEGPWLDHISGWTAYSMHPSENMHVYGRDIAMDVSRTATLLLTDAPATEQLLHNFVQIGIDYYAAFLAGVSWPADGGHASGRIWPIVFAGLLLEEPSL